MELKNNQIETFQVYYEESNTKICLIRQIKKDGIFVWYSEKLAFKIKFYGIFE